MDPSYNASSIQPLPVVAPSSSMTQSAYPGPFVRIEDGTDYLDNLDSDTRDYVLKHTDDTRSRQDIIDCVNELRKGR